MRSRYSAFVTGNIQYLIASLHPSKRQLNDYTDIQQTIDNCHWIHLQIMDTVLGGINDESGEVEFIASFTSKPPNGRHISKLHERSRFIKENNQWFYLDGRIY